jgi:hypothetical protein
MGGWTSDPSATRRTDLCGPRPAGGCARHAQRGVVKTVVILGVSLYPPGSPTALCLLRWIKKVPRPLRRAVLRPVLAAWDSEVTPYPKDLPSISPLPTNPGG